jgi:hypothetical protein
MGFRFRVPQDPGVEVTVDNTWVTKVRANGQDLQRASEKGRPYLIPTPDGTVRRMVLKASFLDPAPKAIIDGTVVAIAKPLTWPQYALGALPLALIFFGGAIGGVIGAVGAMQNINILRSERTTTAKAGLVVAISVASLIAYLVVASMFQLAIRGA